MKQDSQRQSGRNYGLGNVILIADTASENRGFRG